MKPVTLWLATALVVAAGQGFPAGAQNPAPNPAPTPEQQAAKLKAHWSKEFNAARLEFQNNNDRESADFVAGMLDSFERPEGLSPAALAGDVARCKNQVRALVRRGAMESAACLNCVQVDASATPNFRPPPQPSPKAGGTPGPGGLVLYLPFDQPDDQGVVHDESGAGNHGHVFGAQWVSTGKFGGAYLFCQTNFNDRIVIPNNDLLNPDHITVSVWIKAGANTGFWNRIMDKDCWHGYCLSLAGDSMSSNLKRDTTGRGKFRFEGQLNVGSGRGLDDNQWHHVATAFDGRTARCYIDGVEASHQDRNPGPLKPTSWDLCIGNSVVNYGTGELLAFDGLIDEVRIYNRALSAAEIKALASATGAGVEAATPSAAPGAKPDAAERLKRVKALFDQGLINKDDYDKKVKEIMDSI